MQYYLYLQNEQQGPFTLAQLQSMWHSGGVMGQTLYWEEGLDEWLPLSTMIESLEPPRASAIGPAAPEVQTASPADSQTLNRSTIICTYLLAVLMPLAGFFAGVYLAFKKQVGHGLACMAISILVFLIYLGLAS